MKKTLATTIIVLTTWLAGCGLGSDSPTGLDEGPVTALTSNQGGDQAETAVSRPTVNALVQADDAPALETLHATFTAVAGERQTFRIRYDVPEEQENPSPNFFRLDFHQRTLLARPDGTAFAEGDTVLITVTIDPVDLRVELEPSGLQLDPTEPGELRLSYARANPDLNGDGQVDSLDSDLEVSLLGFWVRPGPTTSGADWSLLAGADQDLVDKGFKADIEHFSGYVVAW